MTRIVIAVSLALAASAAVAQSYRWVDKDGRVNYSDTPPPGAVKNVQKKGTAPAASDGPQLGFETQQAAKNFPVVLYTAESCGAACNDAKALLAKRGVPFREISVADEATREELKKVAGKLEVPVMTVGRDVKAGFAPELYNSALDAAGYPQSAAPIAQNTAKPPAAKPEAKPQPAPEPEPPKGRYLPQ